MKKNFCIYTVITGGFDSVKQPFVVDDRFDYIIFSDLPLVDTGVWQVRMIDFHTPNFRLKSRYPKVFPCELLSEYEATLYIDGNIQILSQKVYDKCVELYEQGVEWAGIKHQGRHGLYQELNAIIGLGWVHDYDVINWYQYMRNDGFTDNIGMFENNIIFRRRTEIVQRVSNYWWWSMTQKNVQRDQFSLMWALWKVPEIKTAYFLPENENAWHNDGWFDCVAHNPHKRILDKSLWEKMRDRYVRMFYSSGDWEIYYTKWFDKLIKYPFPHAAMHVWTACMMVRYDLGFLMKRFWKKIVK